MWLVFALLTAFFYATAGMVVKYSIDKNVRDPQGIVAIHGVGALLITGLIWLVGNGNVITGTDLLLPLAAGALIGGGSIGYFKAYGKDDASNVVMLQQMMIPATIILALVFIGDQISAIQIVGAAIIIAGVLLASKTKRGFHLRNRETFIYMLFASIAWAGAANIERFSLRKHDIVTFLFYQTLGYAIYAGAQTLIHHPTRRGLVANLRPFSHRIVWVIVGSEAIFVAATITQLKAISEKSAGLVVSVGSSEIFFSLILGSTLSLLWPHIIKENIEKHTVILKICGGILACVGIVLLNS